MATVIRVHASEDGYLYGAAPADEISAHDSYWHPVSGDCEPCTLTLWEIPEAGDAEVICRHGTSEQYHSDGYECMNYLHVIGTEIPQPFIPSSSLIA